MISWGGRTAGWKVERVRWAVVVWIVLSWVQCAQAQLGATTDQAAAHFGPPVEPPALIEPDTLPPNLVLRHYKKGARKIRAWFLEGIICRIVYAQTDTLTAAEVEGLLGENAQNCPWVADPSKVNPVQGPLGVRVWRRSDRAVARLKPGSKDELIPETFEFWNRDWPTPENARGESEAGGPRTQAPRE